MTHEEAIAFAELIHDTRPWQAWELGTPRAWAPVLVELDASEAMDALIHLTDRPGFIDPATIRREVYRMTGRTRALEHVDSTFVPTCDPDDTAEYNRQLYAARLNAVRNPDRYLDDPAAITAGEPTGETRHLIAGAVPGRALEAAPTQRPANLPALYGSGHGRALARARAEKAAAAAAAGKAEEAAEDERRRAEFWGTATSTAAEPQAAASA